MNVSSSNLDFPGVAHRVQATYFDLQSGSLSTSRDVGPGRIAPNGKDKPPGSFL